MDIAAILFDNALSTESPVWNLSKIAEAVTKKDS